MNSFINSAMNVEFVCLILSGIKSVIKNKQVSLIVSDDSRYSIKSVELGDEKKWRVGSNLTTDEEI